jgi:AraC-like DNA-binding protein
MSRSAFAARFTAQVGMAPIAYVRHWRLSIARDRLIHTTRWRRSRTISAINPKQPSTAHSDVNIASHRAASEGRPPKSYAIDGTLQTQEFDRVLRTRLGRRPWMSAAIQVAEIIVAICTRAGSDILHIWPLAPGSTSRCSIGQFSDPKRNAHDRA